MGFIYVIENIVNNKKYIGQTTRTVKIRWTEHLCAKNRLFSNDIKIHGKQNFVFIKVEEFENSLLDEKEKDYINLYNSLHPTGYNIYEGQVKNLNISSSSKGGKSDTGHEKQSTKVKEKYKNISELNGLIVPQGISFKKQNIKENIQYIFLVRKKNIKQKQFSSMNVNKIPLLLDNAKKYLNEELSKLTCSTGVGR